MSRVVNRTVAKEVPTGTRATKTYASLLKDYRDVALALAPLEDRKKEIEAELFEMMKTSNTLHAEFENVIAAITQSTGKAKNTIEPAKFHKLAKKDDVFYSCVDVVRKRAETFFTKQELAAITTSTPGAPGEKKLLITIN